MSCLAGIMVYINPLYLQQTVDGKEGVMTTATGEVINITEYDKKYNLPWMKYLLIASVTMPFLLTCVLTCTVCIVLCVYLKENFKLNRFFGTKQRSEREYDGEMLKLRYNSDAEDDE